MNEDLPSIYDFVEPGTIIEDASLPSLEDFKESEEDRIYNRINDVSEEIGSLKKSIEFIQEAKSSISEEKEEILSMINGAYKKVDIISESIEDDFTKVREEVDTEISSLRDYVNSKLDSNGELDSLIQRVSIIENTEIPELEKPKDFTEDIDILKKDIIHLKGVKQVVLDLYEQQKEFEERLDQQPEVVIKESVITEPPSTNNSDPLTPLDQNFATLDDLSNHYRLFLNRVQQQLSTLGGGGENNTDGFEYVSDKSHEALAVPLPADTWTKVSNDGASGSTKRQHLPEGVTRIYDVTNDVIKLDQLPNNGWVIFRFGVKVIPNVDNVTLKTRIAWTTGSGFTFYLTSPGALLNDGAGIEYEEQFTLTFYVGDDDTKEGSGILEARADGTCNITDSAFMTIVG